MATRKVVAAGPASSDTNLDLPSVSNDKYIDDQQLRRVKHYSFLTPGDTWEDALALELQAIQQNKRITFAPFEFQYIFEKAILFQESRFFVIRCLRPILILIVNLVLYFVAINTYYINADILFAVGWCVGISAVPVMWYIIYFTQDIRGDTTGKPGPGLRVFQLTKYSKTVTIRRIPLVTTYQILLVSFVTTSLLYMAVRWHDRPAWSILAQLLIGPYLMIPHSSVPMLMCLFPFTTDAAARLIETQKVFVLDEITGDIDWPVAQRNFDILEKFVDDLSRSWQTFFFGASMFWPLALVMLGMGVGSTGMQWMGGDQPAYMPILIAYETLVLAYILLTTIILWNGASQVTAACEKISKQCQEVLSYLRMRMHPTYMNHREEYLRAEGKNIHKTQILPTSSMYYYFQHTNTLTHEYLLSLHKTPLNLSF